MPLSPDELEQIRVIVREELMRRPLGGGVLKTLLSVGGALVAVFFFVLALHVMVIGGFTIYHLMHSS